VAAGAGVWIKPFRNGYRVYYRLEPGAQLHGKAGFKTAEEAEPWAAAMRLKITTKRRTVADAIATYKLDLDARVARSELRRESAMQMEQGLNRIMADVLDLPVGALTARRCKELYESVANAPDVSVGTQHKFHAFAHTWGGWIVKKGWFKTNPFADVEKIGQRKDYRSSSLRVDEARALREAAFGLARRGDQGAIVSLVVLTCSLRPSEVAQLKVRDVDDEGHLLWVDGPRLKTKNTRRAITVADDELRALLISAAKGKEPTDSLFSRHRHRQRVTEAVQRVSAAAGVPVVDSRTLRRTFATLDARRGSSLDALAFNMGHGADSKARTAQKHYIAPGAAQSGAAARVFDVLDGGKGARRR
jgi:integrase